MGPQRGAVQLVPVDADGANSTNGVAANGNADAKDTNGVHYVPADKIRDTGLCVPSRVVFTGLAAVSFAIIYGLKVNLSVAIVAMVNGTHLRHVHAQLRAAADDVAEGSDGAGACPAPPGHAHEVDGPFVWDEAVQGQILGSYFVGYLVAQVPGALMAERLSAKWVMLAAVVANVVGCALTPPVCHHAHYALFVALRVLQGVGAGFTFPAMHAMIAQWAPPAERSVVSGVIYAGTALGTVGSTLLTGYLTAYMGWEWVFYLMALLAAPWCIFWMLWVSDSPDSARFISQQERDYIAAAKGDSVHGKRLPFPTRQVLSSLPFWAILVAHFCSNCGWYMILTELPSFMKHVLHKNIKENAGIAAIPYFLMWVVSVVLATALDRLRTRGSITTSTARKIATGIASVIPAVCLVGISFIKCDADAGTALIIVAVTSIGGMFVGFLANHIDIAPNFAGMLMAITNTIATLPGIFVPMIVGHLTTGHQTLAQWSIAFYTIAALYAIMIIFYAVCGSGEVQSWNSPKAQDEEEKCNIEDK